MKHHRFLLFLTKTTLITIITIGMIGTTIHKASALTDETAIESATSETEDHESGDASFTETDTILSNENDAVSAPEDKNENQDLEDSKQEEEIPEDPQQGDKDEANSEEEETDPSDAENVTDSDDITDSEDTDDSDEVTGSDDVSNPDEGTDSEDVSNPDETTDSDEVANPDEATDSDEVMNPDETTDSDEAANSDEAADSDEVSDSGDTADKTSDSDSHQASESKPNLSTQSETTTSSKANIRDESSDAIYIRRSYNPSETFIDLKDRIKYNSALPLDNIPAFITQEMIIGALKCQDETGYPASVTIAQIIQESGFGKYGPGGEDRQGLSYLAYQYCNLFGIKGIGTAGSVNMRTGEQTSSGEYYTTTAGFRVYNTYTECIEDRTELLKRVYSDLITGVTDANTFAVKIGARWATSLQYSQHLIEQMERYDLYRLDSMTLMDFSDMIGQFSDPCPGSYLTSSFGYRDFDHKFHKGIDLGTNGQILPVYAAESGTVVLAEYDSLAGNWVLIDHGNGLVTKYMHFSYTFVKEGQEVTKGQQIGLTGTTGRSTGIHLHFQVEENGVAVDPTSYLSTVE